MYTAHFLTITSLRYAHKKKKNDDHVIDDGTEVQNKIFLI